MTDISRYKARAEWWDTWNKMRLQKYNNETEKDKKKGLIYRKSNQINEFNPPNK